MILFAVNTLANVPTVLYAGCALPEGKTVNDVVAALLNVLELHPVAMGRDADCGDVVQVMARCCTNTNKAAKTIAYTTYGTSHKIAELMALKGAFRELS